MCGELPLWDLRVGHVLDQLRELPSDFFHAVVTSPPYYQLRDYGTEPVKWPGGWVGELGQEPTPTLFVEHLVAVFDEVRRVLREDGVCFLNIDDTFAGERSYQVPSTKSGDVGKSTGQRIPAGYRRKGLYLVPQRLVIALHEAGWTVRCDGLWNPPNAMPESATDRPTRAHEYLFMLTKSDSYHWDRFEAREGDGIGRNLRSVWTMPTENFAGAHTAVMPMALAEQCIRIATSEKGCCPQCGAPVQSVTVTESLDRNELPREHPEWRPGRYDNGKAGAESGPGPGQRFSRVRRVGWDHTCPHTFAEASPCRVLDPFGGAMTTAVAARRLGRYSMAIELSPEFAEQGRERMDTWWRDVPVSRVQQVEGQLDLLSA